MVTTVTRLVGRWFYLDRRYDRRFANGMRWFFLVFWLAWLLFVVAVSAAGPDMPLALLGLATAGLLVVLFRLVFTLVSKLNNWKQLPVGSNRDAASDHTPRGQTS